MAQVQSLQPNAIAPKELTQVQFLREWATFSQDELIRWNLQFAAIELEEAQSKFAKHPTRSNLERVNGCWAHGSSLLAYAARKAKEQVQA